MSEGAVRRVHAILSAALNYGVSWGWIERNPADYAHPPKLARRQALPPRPEQVAALLNAAGSADEELGVFLWLAVTRGARRGELVALRWSDFELERGLLRVGSSYVVRSGERRLKGTKTGEKRLLSLDSVSIELLTQFRITREAGLAPVDLPLAAFSGGCSAGRLGRVQPRRRRRRRLAGVEHRDFSDNSTHEITVEKVRRRGAGVRYPRCGRGAGGCPARRCRRDPGLSRVQSPLGCDLG